jgi:hypothetical protein
LAENAKQEMQAGQIKIPDLIIENQSTVEAPS